MCGICGVNGFFKNNGAIFKTLLENNSIRGREATGIIWKNRDSEEFHVKKAPVESSVFIDKEVNIPNYCKANILIGHTRNSTSGDPNNNVENHPHSFGKWIVVHNGVIEDVDNLYKECNVEKTLNCDSAVIPIIFEKFGFETGLEKLPGWFSIVAVNIDYPERIYLAKNYANYASVCIGRLDEKTIIFSSIEEDVALFTKDKFMLMPNTWKIYEHGVQIDKGKFISKESRFEENILTLGDSRFKRFGWKEFENSKIVYGD